MEEDFQASPPGDRHAAPMIPPADENPDENISKTGPLLPEEKSTKQKTNKAKFGKASNKLLNTSQLKELKFFQALVSEFIGTLLLTLVATSTGLPIGGRFIPAINGALASGFIVATVIVGFGHVSGAHINPAVTVSFLVAAEIDFLRAGFYICAQLLGAISASAIVWFVTPTHVQGYLGMTLVTNGVTVLQACIVEFFITFILCHTVHAICDKRRNDIGGSKALAVGLAVALGCFFGGPYTGGSMNPARSLGPATIMNVWENHWVYWLGPLAGAIAAALVYTHVLKEPSPTTSSSRQQLDSSNI